MNELKQFHFSSISNIDGESSTIVFTTKGYIKNNSLIYFKHEDTSYKFIKEEFLVVYVNESKYEFNINKKTLAHIVNQGFSMDASIVTNKLEILDNKLVIQYKLDFNSFCGDYIITLEWN